MAYKRFADNADDIGFMTGDDFARLNNIRTQ